MKKLPTLYKKTSTGALQEWTIEVHGDRYLTRYGQTGGIITVSEPTVCFGKNHGRANATTAFEQAELEAQALWEKRLKKDYVETVAEAMAGKSSKLVEGGILPMLAHKFSEHGDKLKYPCYVQPKLDGHRCIAIVDSFGSCTLWSRTRKRINSAPHIVEAIERLGLTSVVFDGELYNHAYHDKFEQLTSAIRPDAPRAGSEIVQYHIYDLVNQGDQATREAMLWKRLDGVQLPLVRVETLEVPDEDALMVAFEKFLAQGYEGAIARNAAGLYVNKRSYDLLKIKQFDDSEYKCVAVEEGRGKLAGHAIFVCVTEDGVEFRAKMKGEMADLRRYYLNQNLVVGRMVTVKYQGLTNKNNVPRFPVAVRVAESL